MKKSIFIITLLLLSFIHVNGQNTVCGSIFDLEMLIKDKTNYQQFLSVENSVFNYKNKINLRITDEEDIIIVPIVVHILHGGEVIGSGFNISDAQIQSQIDVLNEDFRRLNTDKNRTPTIFQSIASDVKIEFRLAQFDPDGNPTNGIQRRQTSTIISTNNDTHTRDRLTKFSANGGLDAWDTTRYLNIWVRDITSTGGLQLLGYAQFPYQFTSSPNTDGVVVFTKVFGRGNYNLLPGNNLGRTTTHEVGH